MTPEALAELNRVLLPLALDVDEAAVRGLSSDLRVRLVRLSNSAAALLLDAKREPFAIDDEPTSPD